MHLSKTNDSSRAAPTQFNLLRCGLDMTEHSFIPFCREPFMQLMKVRSTSKDSPMMAPRQTPSFGWGTRPVQAQTAPSYRTRRSTQEGSYHFTPWHLLHSILVPPPRRALIPILATSSPNRKIPKSRPPATKQCNAKVYATQQIFMTLLLRLLVMRSLRYRCPISSCLINFSKTPSKQVVHLTCCFALH